MPTMTGAEHLRDWMRRRGFTQAEAARYLEFDAPYVSMLANGVRTPGLDNAVLIERLTGIPIEAWLSPEGDVPSNDQPKRAA